MCEIFRILGLSFLITGGIISFIENQYIRSTILKKEEFTEYRNKLNKSSILPSFLLVIGFFILLINI